MDLNRRTAANEVLRDKAFNIAKNPIYDGYQRGPASMVYFRYVLLIFIAKMHGLFL